MAWFRPICGSAVTSSAEPGIDQAITTGTLKRRLRTMPSTALPMEIAQTQDDSSAWDNPALSAAWKISTSGPA
ncbi:hypothetical protein D9M68_631100 [compost metagenome]